MRRLSVIIFDLDNTIYDWYAAFLPAFYEMVAVAASAFKCDAEVLLEQLQRVHIRHHDVEHPFSLAETELVQTSMRERGADHTWALLDPAFHAFNKVRKSNLKAFPGALETLHELRARNIRLVAYTDSKYFAAVGRLERLGLADLFDRVYCREKGISVRPTSYGAPQPSRVAAKVAEIASHESKPNPRVLADIVSAQGVEMKDVASVGDSLAKDVMMAKRAGCFAVWAKYGAHTDRAMYERLIRISHWSSDDIEREKNYAAEARSIEPDLTCEKSLEELLPHVAGPAQAAVAAI